METPTVKRMCTSGGIVFFGVGLLRMLFPGNNPELRMDPFTYIFLIVGIILLFIAFILDKKAKKS